MKKINSRFSQEKGFTLIEIMVTLVIIAILSTGAFMLYQRNAREQKTILTNSGVRQLSESLTQAYGQQGDFSSVSNTAVLNGKLAPTSLIRSNQLSSPFGGTINVSPSPTSNQQYQIVLNNIPSYGCSHITTQLANNFKTVEINNSVVSGLNIPAVTSACASSSNKIAFVSNPVISPLQSGEVGIGADNGGVSLAAAPAPVLASTPASSINAVSPTLVSLQTPKILATPTTTSAVTTSGVAVTSLNTYSSSSGSGSAASCVAPAPTTNTQTLSCQTGYTGNITQTQTTTYSCPSSTGSPVASTGGWVTTSDTCVATQTCSTATTSTYVVNYQGNATAGACILYKTPNAPGGCTTTVAGSAPLNQNISWCMSVGISSCQPICNGASFTGP